VNFLLSVLWKITEKILLPITRRLFSFVYKRMRKRYENDEDFRDRVNEQARQLLKKNGPKMVQLYYELVLGQDTPPGTKLTPEQEFIRSAGKSARAGYQAAKNVGRAASQKAGHAYYRANEWLREDDPQWPHPPEGDRPPDSLDEDEEIERLKKRIDREQTERKANEKSPEPNSDDEPKNEL
jgi:hypothetical protein